MPVSQQTRPMRRLPDAAPRIPHKLRFPILFLLSIDFSFAALIAVIYIFAPLSPNTPAGSPIKPDSIPNVVQTIVLPGPARSATARSAPVTAAAPTAVHRSAPATRKPPATRAAVPTRTPSTPVVPSAKPSPSASWTDPVASPSSS